MAPMHSEEMNWLVESRQPGTRTNGHAGSPAPTGVVWRPFHSSILHSVDDGNTFVPRCRGPKVQRLLTDEIYTAHAFR